MKQVLFIPGSDWMYIKLYTGVLTADKVLLHLILPFIQKLHNKSYIKKWFFIRYTDPDFHLRVRILLNDIKYFGEVIQILNQCTRKWIQNHFIWRLQIDTYYREIERYSKKLIEESESIFFYDSVCILNLLKSINKNEDYRWMITIKLIDEFLSSFSYSLTDKYDITRNIYLYMKKEFHLDAKSSKQVNLKYRTYRHTIELIISDNTSDKNFDYLCKLIKKRTDETIPIINIITQKVKNKFIISKLLMSYIHMTINRIFISENRFHEMIITDFMQRFYHSEIIKNNK